MKNPLRRIKERMSEIRGRLVVLRREGDSVALNQREKALLRNEMGRLGEDLEIIRQKRKQEKIRYRKKFTPIILSLKSTGCACGEKNPNCLDFHHNEPDKKNFTICQAFNKMVSEKRLLEELQKCSVICSNCHRKHHQKHRQK